MWCVIESKKCGFTCVPRWKYIAQNPIAALMRIH
jgi:hypothetical protein